MATVFSLTGWICIFFVFVFVLCFYCVLVVGKMRTVPSLESPQQLLSFEKQQKLLKDFESELRSLKSMQTQVTNLPGTVWPAASLVTDGEDTVLDNFHQDCLCLKKRSDATFITEIKTTPVESS